LEGVEFACEGPCVVDGAGVVLEEYAFFCFWVFFDFVGVGLLVLGFFCDGCEGFFCGFGELLGFLFEEEYVSCVGWCVSAAEGASCAGEVGVFWVDEAVGHAVGVVGLLGS
jgi:hypothetical protein